MIEGREGWKEGVNEGGREGKGTKGVGMEGVRERERGRKGKGRDGVREGGSRGGRELKR